jgi:hypothetical protein
MSTAGPGASPRRPTPPDRAGGRPSPVAAGAAVLAALRDPVVDVFLLAGTFDVLSGDRVVDGVVLFAVAVALGWDAPRRRAGAMAGAPAGEDQVGMARVAAAGPVPAPRRLAGLRHSPTVLVGVVVYAVLAAKFTRYSWPATIAVAAPAAAAVAAVWRRPSGEGTGPGRLPRAGLAAWASIFVALGLWELSALLLQPSLTTDSYVHPTLSVLMDPVLAGPLGRSVVLSLWLASGWYLVGL